MLADGLEVTTIGILIWTKEVIMVCLITSVWVDPLDDTIITAVID